MATKLEDQMASALEAMMRTHGMHGPCVEHSCESCRRAYTEADLAMMEYSKWKTPPREANESLPKDARKPGKVSLSGSIHTKTGMGLK